MKELLVILTSASPISELRGGIPLALYFGYPPLEAYLLAVFGNMVPVPIILFVLNRIEKLIEVMPIVGKIYVKCVSLAEKRKGVVEKYGYLGLTFFVSIPLPVTGAWTGTLIAFLLKMNPFKAVIFIYLGILIAGAIVLTLSLTPTVI
ncbi:putative small multi-drug export [Ferroglobus placidus DSM 10642]|uniref:Putative small multi-drug export n=1 Tax=Ferroglobus placidus (strain DSM 10642 / AEDII12DO) TaxID=589924 RepID=D3RY39_FERPA|nr:small multi-drug export protein [Ferroglobus placidus]ADC65402.1 putative small multi-drug export [Ferroglobus placidus DSM 10642]